MGGAVAWACMAVGAAGWLAAASDEVGKPAARPGTATETGIVKKIREERGGDWSPDLGDGEKATLFAIARDTLDWCLRGKRGAFPMEKYTLTPKLREKSAVFVTYKNRGELRGCIGILEAAEPMYAAVHNYAVHASRDYRFAFNPITLAELPNLEIHVSILSPMRPIASLDEFKLGAHGIAMEKGGARAVFLPEVAIEQKWTREDTLSHLSQKAGLRPDAWKEGARFKVFSSVVLSEE